MLNIRTRNLIVIDIETVSEYNSFSIMPAEWQEVWREKTERILPEGVDADTFYQKRAGIMAEFGKVICICVGYFDDDMHGAFKIQSFAAADEKEMLKAFIAAMNKLFNRNSKSCFAGHNIKEFDIPFLCRRMLINDLVIPPYLDFQHMKPWETNIVDTFQYWRFGDYKNYTSLHLLAIAMKVPTSKQDMDGSMVGELYWNDNDEKQNLLRIMDYCCQDVIATANIILRFKHKELLDPDMIQYEKSPVACTGPSN